MTVKETTQIIICNHCNGSNFKFIPSVSYRLTECQDCKAVRDLTLVSEDVKHNIFHKYGKEPDDKPDDYGC